MIFTPTPIPTPRPGWSSLSRPRPRVVEPVPGWSSLSRPQTRPRVVEPVETTDAPPGGRACRDHRRAPGWSSLSRPRKTRSDARPRAGPASERDVAVRPADHDARVGDRPGQRGPGDRGLHHLVDDADLDGLVHATGDPLVLRGELRLHLRADLRRDLEQLPAVQDADRGDRAHHRDLGTRPGEHLRGAERA